MIKITEIHFNLYRAFFEQKEEKATIFLSENQSNILIYGENGSGKSSIFKGLEHFFESAHNDNLDFEQHYFSKDNLQKNEKIRNKEPYIKVKFSNGNEAIFTPEQEKNTNNKFEFIKNTSKAKGFLSYKNLLKVHLVEKEVNLFDLFLAEQGVLYNVQNEFDTNAKKESKKAIGKLLEDLKTNFDENILKDFNEGLKNILSTLKDDINKMLNKFNQGFEIENFDFLPLKKTTLSKGKIIPIVKMSNKEISRFEHFLNEARLTALSICVYLSSVLKNPERELKILFLDDIFIGLDMSNRLPLLDILKTEFNDYQIFMTTYDRAWFEVAKNKLDTIKWQSIEMYVGKDEEENFDVPVIIQSKDYFERAKEHFKAFDYPACGNYLRKECEKLIRMLFKNSNNEIYLLKNDGTSRNTFGELFDALIQYYDFCDIEFPEYILQGFKISKNAILNPSSHDDIISPIYKTEIEKTFSFAKELKTMQLPERKLFISVNSKLFFETSSNNFEIVMLNNLYKVQVDGEYLFPKLFENQKNYFGVVNSGRTINIGTLSNLLGYINRIGNTNLTEEAFFYSLKDKNGKTLQQLINEL